MDGGASKNIWIIANWKSNKTILEALDWISKVGPRIPRNKNLKVVVCPAFSSLPEVSKAVKVGSYNMVVGSQNLSPFEAGAYTGEEAASLIKDFCQLSIIGHSERRVHFKEDEEMVGNKVKQAFNSGIVPVVCIQGRETAVPEGCKIVAYEPVTAISTGLTNTPGVGKADTPEDANQVADFSKQKYGADLVVLYGGSVDSGNVKGFVTQENISGVLVGKASLDADEFIKIIEACDKI